MLCTNIWIIEYNSHRSAENNKEKVFDLAQVLFVVLTVRSLKRPKHLYLNEFLFYVDTIFLMCVSFYSSSPFMLAIVLYFSFVCF